MSVNTFGVIFYFVFAAIILIMLRLNLMNYFASVRWAICCNITLVVFNEIAPPKNTFTGFLADK